MSIENKRKRIRSESGQAMIEFLFIALLFCSITMLTFQFLRIANANCLVNCAAYSACRDFTVNYESGSAEEAASVYMLPFLYETGGGDIIAYEVDVPEDPGFGGECDVNVTAQFRLLPMPVVTKYFGFVAEQTGVIELKSNCTMTME